jgi:hypothetical protein
VDYFLPLGHLKDLRSIGQRLKKMMV